MGLCVWLGGCFYIGVSKFCASINTYADTLSRISIQHGPLYRAVMYGVTMTCVECRLNFKTHNIRLTPHG